MQRHTPRSLEARGLDVRAVPYKYRYCPRCRREWPAKHKSCPECVHWLGEQPLQRTEWQLAPANISPLGPKRYELVGASALMLRLVCGQPPTEEHVAEMTGVIREILAVANHGATCEVAGHGWLVWTMEGLREAFCLGCEVERRLVASLPRLESVLLHGASIRWGVWTDQYVLPFSRPAYPVVEDVTAHAIFNFEPDNILFSSEAIYRINRRWEHFVCAPHRLLGDQEDYGYRMIGRKRPSALDHAEVKHVSPFVGREHQLSIVDDCWRQADRSRKLAIVAEAGSGKTRLIEEWRARHPEIRVITANFSLFGGDVESFAGQLAELPLDRLDCDALVQAVVNRIHRDKIEILVLDDIHWAGTAGLAFVRELLGALSTSPPFVILASRPSGRERLRTLQPSIELKLRPLSSSGTKELARRLIKSKAVATATAARSKGNPLFIEQFAAWAAETNFQGGESGPRNLHQVIAARIAHLSDVRIKDIQRRLRWGRSWERQGVNDELGRLEVEIGLWLDRLETGDYADRVEAARHLVQLERLDYEIFITSMLAGRPRSRSSRLREAIERLLVGSADQILVDLKRRAVRTSGDKENVSREAQRVGDVLFGVFNWSLAREFYELAYPVAPSWQTENIARRLDQSRLHSRKAIENDSEVYAVAAERNLEEKPNVDALSLPYIWTELARRHSCVRYFALAAEAAEVINDQGLAEWAKHKSTDLTTANGQRSRN
jgi:hypothetical protein